VYKRLMTIMGIAVTMSLISLLFAASAFADPASANLGGSNPQLALPITGDWATLNPGASVWYAFQYAGDASQISVILNDQGMTGLAFGVWTPDRLAEWEAGTAIDAIGHGSPNVDVPADLFWTGNFNLAATYYVKVDNNGASPIAYNLMVTGTGVQ
jgi:hypothetical protein